METCILDLPTMYGDHHVIEVRHILLAMTGIKEVYASSSFQVVELTYDPAQIDAATIIERLTEAGYLGEMTLPVETGQAVIQGSDQITYFRHTAAYHQTGRVISFGQTVNFAGRALWPCPGLGTIKEGE
jgi:copper chaperone CopZ